MPKTAKKKPVAKKKSPAKKKAPAKKKPATKKKKAEVVLGPKQEFIFDSTIGNTDSLFVTHQEQIKPVEQIKELILQNSSETPMQQDNWWQKLKKFFNFN